MAGQRPLAELWKGSWNLSRKIVSVDGTSLGEVLTGAKAWFSETKQAPLGEEWPLLLYKEEGRLRLPRGQELPFHRAYVYQFLSPLKAKVFFYKPEIQEEHLKFFHDVAIEEDGSSAAEHLCVDDLYKVNLQIHSEDSFSMHWRVKGPAKDYEIFSDFHRDQTEQS